jgi:hypothetical protein
VDLAAPLEQAAAGRTRSLGGVASWATATRPGKTRNEDLVHAGANTAWVLDGASVPTGMTACCDRDAAWYVQRLTRALTHTLAPDPDLPLPAALAAAIDDVEREHRTACATPGAATGPSATLALTRRRGQLLDWLVLGDATLLLDTGTEINAISDKRLRGIATSLRAQIRGRLAAGGGYDTQEHRTLLAQLVAAERAARNTPEGYWIAADDPDAADHALTGTARIGNGSGEVRRLALLTDGAERAIELFQLYQSQLDLLDALTRDPADILAIVRAAEDNDPHGRVYPRTSRSDDATALIVSRLPAS